MDRSTCRLHVLRQVSLGFGLLLHQKDLSGLHRVIFLVGNLGYIGSLLFEDDWSLSVKKKRHAHVQKNFSVLIVPKWDCVFYRMCFVSVTVPAIHVVL